MKRIFLIPMLLLFLAVIASAAPLGVGGTVVPNDSTGAPVGVLLASMVSSFASTFFAGTLESRVYAMGGGQEEFWYLLADAPTSFHPLVRLTVNGFTPVYTLDVSQRSDLGAGARPATTADRQLTGVVGWNWGPSPSASIFPGQAGWWLVARVNAPSWAVMPAGVSDGSTANTTAFAPSGEPTQIPEMQTLMLVAGGLIVFGWRRRRKEAEA